MIMPSSEPLSLIASTVDLTAAATKMRMAGVEPLGVVITDLKSPLNVSG